MNSIIFNETDESNHFPALIQAVFQHLDFKKWGFNYEIIHAKRAVDFSSKIILQSELCKVQVSIFRDIRDSEAQVNILYGRLHALPDKNVIEWNGETYNCWHVVDTALNFLDGQSPEDALKNPAIKYDFYEANKFRGWKPLEMAVRRESAIWEHYGQNLFNLFNIHYLDLWERYSNYIKEYYDKNLTWADDNTKASFYKIW